MATYLILNCVFLVMAALILLKFGGFRLIQSKRFAFSLLFLLFLTLVFDNLIIASGIVAYDSDKLLGIYLGMAPVEDFFYSITAMLLLPALWERLRKEL